VLALFDILEAKRLAVERARGSFVPKLYKSFAFVAYEPSANSLRETFFASEVIVKQAAVHVTRGHRRGQL